MVTVIDQNEIGVDLYAGRRELLSYKDACGDICLVARHPFEKGNNILDSRILEPSSGKHVVAGFSPRSGAEGVATKTRAKARDYTFGGVSAL